jgi:arabinosyltransferase C
MGLSIPWAILSAYGVHHLLRKADLSSRRLVTALVLLALCGTSFRWFTREVHFINLNVSNTTRHPVFLSPDIRWVLEYMNKQHGRQVVLAFPGNKTPLPDQNGQEIPDSFATPVIPDFAPIVSGFTGAYSYAGHWSETPDYSRRVGELIRFFLARPVAGVSQVMTPEERTEFLRKTGATYVLIPRSPELAGLPLIDPAAIGQVVYSGSQLELVKVQNS